MRIQRCTAAGLLLASRPRDPVAMAVANPPHAVMTATQMAPARETLAESTSGVEAMVILLRSRLSVATVRRLICQEQVEFHADSLQPRIELGGSRVDAGLVQRAGGLRQRMRAKGRGEAPQVVGQAAHGGVVRVAARCGETLDE